MSRSKSDDIHHGHRQRLRTAYLRQLGSDTFNEHQLLELLLFYAIPRRDVNPLAHELINKFGSLYNLLNSDPAELIHNGVSENVAILLHLIMDINRYADRSRLLSASRLPNLASMVRFCYSILSDSKIEQLCIVFLDSTHRILHYDIVSKGTENNVPLSARYIAELGIKYAATSIVIGHNHPSGNPMPSQDDADSTLSLDIALSKVGINLIDHVIVGFPFCYAMMNNFKMRMVSDEVENFTEQNETRDVKPRTVKRAIGAAKIR